MKPVIIVGAGGHGRVMADLAHAAGQVVAGFIDQDPSLHAAEVLGTRVLGGDEALSAHGPDQYDLVLGLGGVGDTRPRQAAYDKYTSLGYSLPPMCHPSAVVGQEVAIAPGAHIMAGAILQTGVSIGVNTIVNTGASLDHDCSIGGHAHLAPGVTLSGDVTVGDGAHLGTGASVIQGITVGNGALVMAGSVVTKDVAPQARVGGIPARSR